jgi:phage shock protein PspC (stress-responsive transcriptional regulator)
MFITMSTVQIKKIYRSSTDKIIAGVAGGLGQYFNLDATIIRGIFALLTLMGGSGILVYLILWIIIPSSPESRHQAHAMESDSIDQETETKPPLLNETKRKWLRLVGGIIIIIFGLASFLNQIMPLPWWRWRFFWPLILIIIGVLVIIKGWRFLLRP